MTKVPVAGNVKTRLQPHLTAEQCATLAACFLSDTVSKVESLQIPLIIAFAPVEQRQNLLKILPEEQILVEQTGANLGEKMFNAFQFAFSQNIDAVVMIGTDSPTFPAEFLELAFDFLEAKTDAVLGKSEDGGFYLIGLRKIHKRIFENVEWSSPKVFEQTTRNIEQLKINLQLIPEWFDVDSPDDLRRLRDEILRNEQTQKIAPRTVQWLNANTKIFR